MTSCALSLNQYRTLEKRTLNFKDDGTGLEYRQRICTRRLLILKKCYTTYKEYLFSDTPQMIELAKLKFKAKVM